MFLLISATGYYLLRSNIITNNEKDTQILFYKIQIQTSDLLSNLLYQYSLQKETLLTKHKEVRAYLQTQANPLDANLENIYKTLNSNTKDKPYNIYITDKDLVIRNTTFKKDIGFDLSFAKSSFDEHFEQNSIGICTPLFEKSSKHFLSYTDSYLDINKSGVLQVSYTYKDSRAKLLEIQKTIAKNPNIVDAKAYIMVDTGFVNDIILKDYPSYTPDLKEILSRIDDGKKINNKLIGTKLLIDKFTKNTTNFQAIYLSTQSAIFDNTKVVYSLVIDETSLDDKLTQLNLLLFIISVLGVVAILLSSKTRKKEIKLSEQDKFVQSSMHEIKTPLSIITLNNELRELELGKDEYSQEIDSAIKTLKTSYEDMNFIITQNKLDYPLEYLDLNALLYERVEYFKTIANSNSKSIFLESSSSCQVNISKVELIRLIDNNLSNAIKYSDANSEIKVKLQNNMLSFHNSAKPIQDTKGVFKKYFRENIVVGGHGLGLSIVSDIAKKYSIDISLTSSREDGTTFNYTFKCHVNDIS